MASWRRAVSRVLSQGARTEETKVVERTESRERFGNGFNDKFKMSHTIGLTRRHAVRASEGTVSSACAAVRESLKEREGASKSALDKFSPSAARARRVDSSEFEGNAALVQGDRVVSAEWQPLARRLTSPGAG